MSTPPKITIAIDGFSSCGKSTLARQLAARLNYRFIDSGAMYRAITLYFMRHHITLDNQEAVNLALSNIHLDISYNHRSGLSEIFLNDENVSHLIREMTVAEQVSNIAALKSVRKFAVEVQQKMGRKKAIVMDGRDIGTVVFPHAELKVFLTADPAIRVKRRFLELYPNNPNITIEEVQNNLELRDYIDSHREESPLRKADDAIVLDNSYLNEEEQLEKVLTWVKQITNTIEKKSSHP